jgi:hypothetical protein
MKNVRVTAVKADGVLVTSEESGSALRVAYASGLDGVLFLWLHDTPPYMTIFPLVRIMRYMP